MGDTLWCQRRSFDRAAPLATADADRSEHRVQYRASQPDAARLDFANLHHPMGDYNDFLLGKTSRQGEAYLFR
jgi:hypothetical protein